MTSRCWSLAAVSFGALLSVAPAAAHHSFAAQYDASKRVTLTGPVTKVEWMNPHIYFYADVKDETTGAVTNYAFEMGGPNSLIRMGWTRNSLKAGDVVTVEGSLARDGSPLVNASSVVMTSTGKRMFAGSSEETTP
jgi:hypothetical protein